MIAYFQPPMIWLGVFVTFITVTEIHDPDFWIFKE